MTSCWDKVFCADLCASTQLREMFLYAVMRKPQRCRLGFFFTTWTSELHAENVYGIRRHQIDAEITRLTKQLEYLQRVRQQYAYLIDTEQKTVP